MTSAQVQMNITPASLTERRSTRRNWRFGPYSYWYDVRKAPVAKPQQRSEEEVLDQGIQQLLRATKDEAKKRRKPLRREQLRKEGCSERFIEKVEKA
jgi:hypothetical protein